MDRYIDEEIEYKNRRKTYDFSWLFLVSLQSNALASIFAAQKLRIPRKRCPSWLQFPKLPTYAYQENTNCSGDIL